MQSSESHQWDQSPQDHEDNIESLIDRGFFGQTSMPFWQVVHDVQMEYEMMMTPQDNFLQDFEDGDY
jgi:hypothetical protein